MLPLKSHIIIHTEIIEKIKDKETGLYISKKVDKN